MFCGAGLSPELKQSIRGFCLRESCISPSKRDTIWLRDERGNLIELAELNSDEQWKEGPKQYHTTHVKDLHVQWQYENMDLMTSECLSKGRPMTCRKTFTKYIPNQVQKTGYLSQFACAVGTEFEWMHQSFMKMLSNNHHCTDANKCINSTEVMGAICTCSTCSNCLIIELQSIPAKHLLHHLCCNLMIIQYHRLIV